MPTTDTATQPLAAVAVLRGGLASAAREVCGSFVHRSLPCSWPRTTQSDSELTLLQPVTADVGGPIASTLATALWAMGAVMPSVAYACARLATKVLSVSSVSTGLYPSLSVHTDIHRHVTTYTRTLASAYTCVHMYLSIPVHTYHTCSCQWQTSSLPGVAGTELGLSQLGGGGEEGSLGPCLCLSKACGWAESE